MLEALALNALIERCAPPAAREPLAAIVREASGGEPLVLTTLQGGRSLPVQASSPAEAIALAAEMRLAGQPVRIGLAGVDLRDLDRLRVPLAEAFEPCGNIRAAAQVHADQPARLRAVPGTPSPARLAREAAPAENAEPIPAAGAGAARARPSDDRPWDVYRQTLGGSVLVYRR